MASPVQAADLKKKLFTLAFTTQNALLQSNEQI
jgi:hypothetical protein